jgi:5,10-methylenetetrahydrofolate reductase
LFEALIEKLHRGTYITLETTPAHSPKFEPIVDKIAALGLDAMVDGFSTTDNPLAKLKYNALFAAIRLQARFNKPVLATMSMRDRNRIALQSDLLGANEANVLAILTLTGDPAKNSDQPNAKGVFESDSTLLLDIIRALNGGTDYAEKPLGEQPETIYPFAVVNAHAKNPKTLQKKMHKKIFHGAQGIITQPVFDVENAKMLLQLMENAKREADTARDSTLILGLFPITKLRTAMFLDSHVPGIDVPAYWIEKLEKAHRHSAEEEYRVGFELSKRLFEQIKELHPKIHLMTANQFAIAKELLS